MENKEYIIKTEDISLVYDSENGPGPKVLDGVNLNIEKGSFVAVLGRNGSGKSTIAKHCNALLLPTEGKVFVDGMDTADESLLWEIRKTVGMVFQNPDNQLVSSVVEDDVAFGPENIGVDPKEIRQRVDSALNAVNMYEFRKRGPHLLSGGQKQRVAIAGVLAMLPECIVFDEPTAMLDPSGRKEIMAIIEKLHAMGKTILLITHFMEEAARADRVIVMSSGKIVLDGTPAEVFANEDRLKELDLELPFAAKLANGLRNKGLSVPADIITDEALADWLCSLK